MENWKQWRERESHECYGSWNEYRGNVKILIEKEQK